jgi:hypothetical protein
MYPWYTPTNVNYTQLAQVTSLPPDLKAAVNGKINGASVVQISRALLLVAGVAATIIAK